MDTKATSLETIFGDQSLPAIFALCVYTTMSPPRFGFAHSRIQHLASLSWVLETSSPTNESNADESEQKLRNHDPLNDYENSIHTTKALKKNTDCDGHSDKLSIGNRG